MHLKCLYGREIEIDENNLKEGLLIINKDIEENEEKEENVGNINFGAGENLNIQFPQKKEKIIRTNENSTINVFKKNCASNHLEYKMRSKSTRYLGYGLILSFGLGSTLMKIISFF